MLIGKVARQAGVNVQTLRYYELRGLLPSTKRRISGYREYDDAVVPLVRFIKNAQELGFTLREIAELLELRNQKPRNRANVRKLATQKIDEMDRRICHLTAMKSELVALVGTCKAGGSECAIITAIGSSKAGKRRSVKPTNGGSDVRH